MRPDNPFDGPLALGNSRYFALKNGRPVLLSDPETPPDLTASAIIGAFRGFVLDEQFSCVPAKSTVNRESIRLGVYDALAEPGPTAGLSRDLFEFTREAPDLDAEFATFVAAFRAAADLDEVGFERLLWRQLQLLHDRDAPLHDWDPAVSPDPDDPHFGFSFAGTAYYIVGLHPGSSRVARRFPWPVLVFNPHAQFEALRAEGRYEKVKQVVRLREERLQGDINPVLADHGAETEARQYSGRNVEPDWHPPFQPHPGVDARVADVPVGGCPFAHLHAAPHQPTASTQETGR